MYVRIVPGFVFQLSYHPVISDKQQVFVSTRFSFSNVAVFSRIECVWGGGGGRDSRVDAHRGDVLQSNSFKGSRKVFVHLDGWDAIGQ